MKKQPIIEPDKQSPNKAPIEEPDTHSPHIPEEFPEEDVPDEIPNI